MAHETELIDYLSKEIETQTNNLNCHTGPRQNPGSKRVADALFRGIEGVLCGR